MFIDNILRALINDLEMSFGRVEVIHETQFQNAATVAGMSQGMADELSYVVGLKTAPNQELPAVIVIEKVRDQIKFTTPHEPIATADVQNPPIEAQQQNVHVQEVKQEIKKFESFVDMSMIKLSPNGYVGSFLDRHLVYTIEDQNRVVNLDRGTRTLQVSRRFSDFVSVRDYLLAKYPFRCIPRLPAKRVQMFSDEAFLIDRQKSLRRFLGIISHHHMYKSDPLIQAFVYNQKVKYTHLVFH